MKGVNGGFCQANHGKAASLKRMKKDDMVLFYSSKITLDGNEKLQAFTAVGKVKDNEIFQFDMGNGFVPFRRRIEFMERWLLGSGISEGSTGSTLQTP